MEVEQGLAGWEQYPARPALKAGAGAIACASSGFHYRGDTRHVSILPKISAKRFQCFWSNATAWRIFTRTSNPSQVRLRVHHGTLTFQTCELNLEGAKISRATRSGTTISHQVEHADNRTLFRFAQPVQIDEGQEILFQAEA